MMNQIASEQGVVVAYPAQTVTANTSRCWNWFKPEHQQRDRGEPAAIADMTRAVTAEYGLDAKRVYVAGLSAGGAAAAVMARTYPDIYAAVGIHSGIACGIATDQVTAMVAMNSGKNGRAGSSRKGIVNPGTRFVPVITFHGERDGTVHPSNSDAIVAQAYEAFGAELKRVTVAGELNGTQFTRETLTEAGGSIVIEQWTLRDHAHAWSGGNPQGSYAVAEGPSASREMMRFFLSHHLSSARTRKAS
jgi:poly(hydroxyalkanoate) depolymerase family esterase